jgi:RHS repeat-associated protein
MKSFRTRWNRQIRLAACALLLAIAIPLRAVAQSEPAVAYRDDFETYKTQSSLPGWADTSISGSLAAGLYKTWPDPLLPSNIVYGTKQASGKPDAKNPRIGTFSTLTTHAFAGKGRFEFRGRFLRTDPDTRIGVGFFSSYPESDSYYLVGLWQQPAPSSKLTMQLFAAAGTADGTVDSAFTPSVDRWYRFLVQVDDVDRTTRIRARFWPDGEPEPAAFSLEASDSSPTRLATGRIALWSAVRGDAFFDDLSAKSPVDHTSPSIVLLESGTVLDPTALAQFGRDARVEIRVTDDLSTFTALATLDGAAYTSLDPIAAEGAHSLRVHAVDAPGNVADVDLKLVVDKTPPQVTISESGKLLANGALFNRDVIPAIVATDFTDVKITATVDGNSYAIGSAIATEGTHSLAVRAEDAVGFVTTLPPVSFTIDKTPPRVTFTSPAPGATIGTAHTVVAGEADDAVTLSVDGIPASIDAAKKFVTAKPLDFVEGENSATAVAADRAGNSGNVSMKVIVDTRAPQLSITTPAANTCVDATAVEIHGRSIDTGGSAVKVKSGDATVDALFAADKESWSATVPAPQEGPLSMIATAVDPTGHTATAILPIVIDRTKPVVEVMEGGAPFTAAAVNRAIALFLRAIDSDVAAKITATLDGAAYASGSAITAEGTHELRVTATDCAGHVSDEKVVRFAVDKTAPQITNIAPPNGATVGEKPLVSGSVPLDCVRVAIEGSAIAAAVVNGTFTFAALPLKEGTNRFVLVATDGAGNESRLDYAVTLKTAAPFISITEGGAEIPPNALYRRPVAPMVNANDTAATVVATLNAAPFVSGATISADGDYLLSATATDRFGHAAAASATFTIDRTRPTITITAPPNEATIHADRVDVSGTAGGADVASVSVNGIAATLTGGTFTASVPLDPGPNLLVVVAADRHGNRASVSIPVTRDDGRLALIVLAPADHSLTNRPTAMVTGQVLTVTVGARVSVNGNDVAIDTGGVFRAIGIPLVEGDNTITAALHAPNGTTTETAVHVTADFTTPVLKLLANGGELAGGMRFASSPSITVDASDTNGASIRCTLDGASVTPPLVSLTDGAHALIVVARDAAGNESRVERTFIVGSAGSGAGCQLTAFDPPNNSGVFADVVRIAGRASGASNVLVNGTRANFADASFCATVPMQPGRNDVRIECADTNGASTSPATFLTLYRYTDATILVTSPQNGALAPAAKTIVSGTVGAGVVSGDVNGLPFTIPDDGAATHSFTVTDVPLTNGLNVLLARARTSSGRIAMTSVRVKYFGAAPLLAITSPLPATRTGAAAIDVSGTWANIDPSTIAASLGSSSFTATARQHSDTTGTFVVTSIPLAAGTQVITVTGRSRSGVPVSATVDVERAAGAPWIAIATPADDTVFPLAATKPDPITGSVSPAAGTTVQVNGVPATVDPSGGFSAAIDFSGAVTPVVARAIAPDGSSAFDAIRIIRLAKPLTVIDSYPAANAVAVDPGVLIVLLFANPIDGMTAASSLLLADSSGAVVAGEFFVDNDAISFAPLRPLTPNTTYTLTAAATLKDISGAPLDAPYSLTFSIAGSAPASAPRLDQQDSAGCFTATAVSGHASVSGARLRLDVDGVTMTTIAAVDASFRFDFTLSGQGGLHLARVREVGADGTLSPDATVCFRTNCAAPQILGASLDRAAKTLVVQFSKPMKPETLTAGPAGTIQLTPSGSPAIAGTVSMNAAADTATLSMTADLSPPLITLVVKKDIQDATGISMAADYAQAFTTGGDDSRGRGEGYVSGAVYDATSGRPLAGAQIDIAAPVNAFSHSAGIRASEEIGAPPARRPERRLPAAAARAGSPRTGRQAAGAPISSDFLGTQDLRLKAAPRLVSIVFATGPATSDDRGRYSRALAEGAYTVETNAAGFTTVWRQVVVPVGAGVIPIDIRLTRRAAEEEATGAAMVLTHGGQTAVTKLAELSLPATSIAPGRKISLTSVGAQSLAGLLPLGWSAAAAAEIAIEGSSRSAPLPGARLAFTLPADEVAAVAAATQTLSLAQYDPDRDEWRTVEAVASIDPNRRASFDITSSGAFALVYPDNTPDLARPLPARTGATLQGVANPCVENADVCRLVSRSFVLTPQAVLPNGRTTALLTVDGVKPYPSGTAVQATIDEQLNLADGRIVTDPPFSTDLLIYRTIAGDGGTAVFHVAPTPQAGAAMLRDGVDHIRIADYPGRIDRGSIIGSEGGRLPGDDAVVIDVPPGAATEPMHASTLTMSSAELAAIGAVAGFRVAAGFTLSVVRVTDAPLIDGVPAAAPFFVRPVRGTFTIEAAPDAQVIVAEVLERTPFGSMLRLAALTTVLPSAGDRALRTFTTRSIDPQQLPVDGIVRAGRYLVLVATSPIAFAFGEVRTAGAGIASARVTAGIGVPQSSLSGVADLTRPGGGFAIPVAAKPAATFSLVARSAAIGDGAAMTGPKNPDAGEIVPFGALQLVATPPRLVSITPHDGSIVNATDPFVVQATFDVPLDPASATNAITVTDSISGKSLPGTASIAGAAATFTPTAPLLAAASYTITVGPAIRAANAAPFGQVAVVRISTRAIPQGNSSIHPERIHITIPLEGKSTISGTTEALPAGSQAVAVRRGSYFLTVYQATVAADGSFSFTAGNPGTDAIATTDAVDLEVVDAISRAIIAVIPLTPFVTADGNGFLAPAEVATKFTTASGVTISVPSGAFATPTLITAAPSTRSDFDRVPSFDHDLGLGTSVRIEFEGVASKRLDVELPIPSGVDPTNRSFYLGYLGSSVRGPRVMVVDTLRAANGKFSTALDATAAAQGHSLAATSAPRLATRSSPLAASTGVDVKNTLLGLTHSGTYGAVEINTGGAGLAWGVIDGLQGGNDLFWTAFDALYAAHFYLTEARGRIAIPLLNNKQKFEVVGVDASTGLTAFSKVYDPLPDGDPGAAVIITNPNPDKEGPYPVFGTPFRIETAQIDAEKLELSVRNFTIQLDGGFITASNATESLPAALSVALFNSGNGQLDAKRSDGLKVEGQAGDRVALFVEQQEVDPYSSLSVVFSKPLFTGESDVDAQIDAYLAGRFKLQASRDPSSEPFANVIGAHYRADSGGRRVLIELPSSLQRGYGYQLIISDALADRSGPGGGPGLRLGQVVLDSGTTEPQTMVLRFRVRAPGGKLNTFDIASGVIRDEALNGNVLLLTALDAGILAYDIADPASAGGGSLLGEASMAGNDAWALASDHHGRIYATGIGPLFGFVRSYRLEDFLPDATHPAPRQAAHRGSAIVSFAPGASVNMALSSASVLSDRPEAIPRKLQILLQDREESFDSLAEFKAAAVATVSKTGEDGEFEIFAADVARNADLPYAGQRITVENLTLDLRWSADAHENAKAHIDGIVARKDDRFRLIHNRMTYGVISLFGFGIGVYDLNAIESNDDAQPPAGYKAMSEVVRITSARLGPECNWGTEAKPIPNGAIPDLQFTPEAAIITRDGTSDLFVYGVDPARGLLDVRIHPPVTQADALLPADSSLCDERPPIGFVLQNGAATPPVYHPRIEALRKSFLGLTGRDPVGRFAGVSYYPWTLEAKDNKAVGPAPADGGPAPGVRGSIAGQRVTRDYLLVPGFELGVLVVEVGGQPPPADFAAGYSPLAAQHLVDIIWIPSGAYAVRAIPRSNLATVVDGEGRVLLVDLARLDERFAFGGKPIADDALFTTVSNCLAANGAYGVGLPDPRIVWQSDPQPDAISTLAPLIDAETGFVYRGRLLKKSTDVIAAVDPKVEIKCELAQPGGLSAVGGIIPLGVDPPKEIATLIAAGDPSRKANASAAAFRLELSLPGAVTDALSKAGNKVRLAVESERVAGGVAPQTPDGFPRAHLRQTTRSGNTDPRAATAFEMKRVIPPSQNARLRAQKGYNRFISPWIVAMTDPRASIDYKWTFPPGTITDEAQRAYKAAQGCTSCTRPAWLLGKSEQNDVWELLSNGRLIAVRPDLCSGDCTQNLFSNSPYEYLGKSDRLFTRFATVPADSVRPTSVLVAAQNAPVAAGVLQETTYLHSGEVEVASTDFDFGGRNGWNVSVDRSYRSRTLGGTALGTGWDSPLFRRLRPLPNANVEYRDGAEVWLFRWNGAGYDSPKGLFLRLSRNDRGWRLSDQKHRVTGFDNLGRLVYEADEFTKNPDVSDSGNVIRYLYDVNGRLTRIVDPVGRSTALTYFGDASGIRAGLLQKISDWRDRVIDYDYDALGRLTTVGLPDVANTSGSRPTVQYGYAPVAGDSSDKIELAPNLTAIVDPGSTASRVAFVYGTVGDTRDRVVRQEWSATGEVATFQYDSPVQVTTVDALAQQRVVKLGASQSPDAAADRVHAESIEEREVTTSTVALGVLPVTTSAGPQRAPATRTMSFTYNAEGMLDAAAMAGVAATLYAYTTPASGQGLLPAGVDVVPATPEGGTKLTRTFEYQSGSFATDVSSFLKSVAANGVKIETPELSPLPNVSESNDSVTRTTDLDPFGRPKHVTTAGGTDGSNVGSDTTFAYVPPSGPKHAIGNLAKVTRTDGTTSLTSEIVYESVDKTVELDERNIATTTKLDAWDRPVDITVAGPDGIVTSHEQYEYDAAGLVKRHHRDQSGKVVTSEFDYDALGRTLSSTTDNVEVGGTTNSLTTKTSYNLPQRTIVRTEPTTATTTQLLDGLGRLQVRTASAGTASIVEEFAYDAAGNQVFAGEKCASCGTATWIAAASAYDAHGRVTATLNADGTKTLTSGYDGWGNPQSIEQRDAAGATAGKSSVDFSPAGRLRGDTTDLGSKSRQSEYRWDGAGRSTISSTSGRTSSTRFDALGRVQSSATGEGTAAGVENPFASSEVPPTGYSGALVLAVSTKEKGASAVPTKYGYDALGRTTIRKVGDLEWKQDLDEAGNVKSSSMPSRPPTQYEHDGRGAVTRETRADASQLNHQYDAGGAATSYADPLETTATENDLLGRPVKRTYPDATTETFAYDGSRLREYVDRQGRRFLYEYDQAGRLHHVRAAGGELIEQRDYDSAGRLQLLTTASAGVRYGNFDLGGRPHQTTQTRYKDQSAFTSKSVLDEYSQTHDYNEHGERTSYTLPYNGTAAGWTTSMALAYDAAGNVREIKRVLSGSTAPRLLLSAEFRSSGRPVHRDLTTDCAAVVSCTPTTIARQYAYDDPGGGQMNEVKVIARGHVVAGTHLAYDGLQLRAAELLGIGGSRVNEFTYDERSRLKTSAYGKPSGSAGAEEKVEAFDFRSELVRPKSTPADPPSLTFAHAPGHKIASVTRDAATRVFSYGTGAERVDDGRFTYEYDARGRMARATQKAEGANPRRRISYDYSATDRVVGRTAEYATVPSPSPSDWKIEDRAVVLEADALPAQTTFIWDPISDQLVAIARAGASAVGGGAAGGGATGSPDPNGGMLRQILHGGLAYDDPLEVTVADPSGVQRLYPIFESAGSLEAILNANGEVVSRTVMQGAYGEDPVTLTGVAIDRIAVRAQKDSSGALASVEVTLRATESLNPSTIATGGCLAALTSDGTVVRTSSVTPTLQGSDTLRWTLTAADWSKLIDTTPVVMAAPASGASNITAWRVTASSATAASATANAAALTPALLSIAATSSLRSSAWSAAQPILPAPEWAIATQPIFSSTALPVESRQSLTALDSFITTLAPNADQMLVAYNIDSLAALADPTVPRPQRPERLLTTAPFHALPFAEPATELLFARARWLDRATGSFLAPDPVGYEDSSNLIAYCAGDPVNCRDASGRAGYFFDGTWNDEQQMKNPTNVAKLRGLYRGEKFYLPGVGTRWYSKYVGGFTGAGGQARIYEMYDSLVDTYNKGDKSIDIFGTSRGGALAVDFANFVRERGIPDKSSAYQQAVGDGMTVTRYRRYFHPEIRFLGVFDVVGSFGMPGDDSDPGHDLRRPTNVKNIRHATAQNEGRWAYPLTSLLDAQGRGPTNVIERAFRGAHSDVVGGYPDNDELSRVPLGWMWQEALQAGVPFAYLPENERTATRTLVQHDESSWIDSVLNWLDRRDTNRTIYYQQGPYNPLDYVPAK